MGEGHGLQRNFPGEDFLGIYLKAMEKVFWGEDLGIREIRTSVGGDLAFPTSSLYLVCYIFLS